MPLVALTGGIASGKSTIARRLVEHGAVVVYDVPLLVEARADDPWELIVVAYAPADVRRRRLVELRGMTESDAAARIASQVSDEARLAIADVVIDTAGSLEETTRQVDDLWERLDEHVAERTPR